MKQIHSKININTEGKSLTEITKKINEEILKSNVNYGFLNLSILHTSASLIVQENADDTVLKDLLIFYDGLVKEKEYNHNSEGADDMPAHIKSSLTQTHLTFSIMKGILVLGKWQGIYLFEHRKEFKNRSVLFHFLGE